MSDQPQKCKLCNHNLAWGERFTSHMIDEHMFDFYKFIHRKYPMLVNDIIKEFYE